MSWAYEPGEVLCDEYVVRLLLGQGGMGEVYLVEHVSSGDLRAAKVMRVRSGATDADLVGFRREALSLLNLGNHPMVVRLFDVREDGRDTVLLMEYVAPESGCTTLQDCIGRTQDYNDRLIGAWSVEFCVGMEHALACRMAAHRDIKPGNLLIGSSPFLKIADFGLALAASHHPAVVDDKPRRVSQLQWLKSADGRLTCGTPGYIAPELFAGGKASPQSDMFSFGVTLWQVAARSLASAYEVTFDGDPTEYQRAILKKAHAHAVRPIDSPYFEVIRRCLAPDPLRRYPDFPSLREAIKSAAKAAGVCAMDFMVAAGFRGSFEEFVTRGRSYLVLGRYERALRILDQAVQHKPDSPEALVAQGEALTHRGQFRQAVRAYESAHRLNPDSDAPLTGLALAWLDIGNTAQARAALDRVLSRHPANLDAQLILARIMGAEGNNRGALDAVEKVIVADPQDWRAHDYHGRALWGLGKLVDAAKAFGTCLRINPLTLDARLSLASVLTEQKDLSAADAEYQHGIRLFKDNPEALNKIAAHMAEHGHAKKAIGLFEAIADAEPGSRSIMLVNIGNAHLRLDDRQSAIESFQQAIKADPENALAYSRLGDMENENGRIEKAAGYFARACTIELDNASYHASAGTAYLQLKDNNRAATHLRRSVELFPEQPLTLYNLAVALLFTDTEDAAIKELAKAVRIDDGYARAWYLKAQVEKHLGRTADAAASARRAAAKLSDLAAHEREALRALIG
ncbi:tetratricopeptide repeat protein [Mesorhizobium sp. M0185]|uniref:tetratricopeptide repeat protein n=1 Tax=Mesorhizobium sp. M0185 TaxID=2956907 RepID=UPI003339A3E8